MKTALITGVNGFVGGYLKAELEANGYTVVGVGRESEAKHASGTYIVGDVTRAETMAKIVADVQPTHIFYLAGISSPPFAEKNPELTFATHVDGTRYILDAALTLPVKPRVLIVSSSHVYGQPNHVPIVETDPLVGGGVYAESRKKQEALVATYIDRLPIIVTRSFNHTGPGQPDTFVVPKIIKQIARIKKGLQQGITMGDPTVKRDISDVRDVVRAYRLLLEQDQFGRTCNVCRGASISLKALIECGRVVADLPSIDITVDPAFVRAGDPADVYGSRAALDALIGSQTLTSYEQLVADMFTYWDTTIIE